jgi:TRAP-type C4-dicarboxylate transport system permease small subunit
MKNLQHITRAFVWGARAGAGISFLVLICAVLLQVVGRTTGNSPVWTEELTRYALLYLVAFGGGLSLRSGDMVNVDVFSENLPGRGPWMLRFFAAIVTFGLMAYLLAPAWKYVSIGRMQTSPALGLQMTYVHFTVWLLLLVLAIAAVLRIVGMIAGYDDGTPEKKPEES